MQRHRVTLATWGAVAAIFLILVCVLESPGRVGGRERSVTPGISDAYTHDPNIEKSLTTDYTAVHPKWVQGRLRTKRIRRRIRQ